MPHDTVLEGEAIEVAQQPRADARTNASLGLDVIVLLLLWPLLVAAAAGYYLEQRAAERASALLEDRPRLVVLNEADFVRKAAPGASPELEVQAALREADAAAGKLEAAGYVVLRHTAVHRAPPEARVAP